MSRPKKPQDEGTAPIAPDAAPHLPPNLERFKLREIHRSEAKNLPYNPRVLSDEARKRLRKILERLGLLAPLTWNVRTGFIVGGNQRLRQLDDLMGTSNYRLTVAEVDLSESEEREAAVALNAEQAHGDWDLEKLKPLLTDDSLRLDAMGYGADDVHRLFGSAGLSDRAVDEIQAFGDKLAEARERQEQLLATVAERNDENFYLVVVFRSSAEVDGFLERAKLPLRTFQSGEDFARLLDAAQAARASLATAGTLATGAGSENSPSAPLQGTGEASERGERSSTPQGPTNHGESKDSPVRPTSTVPSSAPTGSAA